MTVEAHNEAFEKILSSSLDRAVDFIKFAEAKNAALFTFATGCAIALSSVLITDVNTLRTTTSPPVIPGLTSAFSTALALFVAVILVTLWSFLPNRRSYAFHRDPTQAENLLFFSHVAKFDAGAFRSKARARYLTQTGSPLSENYLNDLSDQVAINCAIADRKFTAFDIGAYVTFVAIVVALIPLGRVVLNTLAKSFAGP